MALRITGSVSLFTKRFTACTGLAVSPSARPITLPVSIKPHVEAFTNTESEFFRWDFQSATPKRSLINASAVSASGIRINASAKHISKIPSWVSKLYSKSSASIICTAFLSLRIASIKRVVFSAIAAFSAWLGVARGNNWVSHWDSSTIYSGEISDHSLSSGCSINAAFNTSVAVNMWFPSSHT